MHTHHADLGVEVANNKRQSGFRHIQITYPMKWPDIFYSTNRFLDKEV